MAIQFARMAYVKRSAGQSACHKAAYNGRDQIQDLRAGKTYNYSQREDSAYHAVLLPEGVSERYTNVSTLWNAVEAVEKRHDAQVAKEMVLALPDDSQVTLEDRIALVRGFVDQHFVQKGLICQVDIHEPHGRNSFDPRLREDDPAESGVNWHAHILMPTRTCAGEVFGLKARHLDVDVRGGRVMSTDKQWGRLWADYQNAYFKENGIDLTVDPIGVVPQIHLGPVRMRGKALHLISENEQLKGANERASVQPAFVMENLLKQHSTFVRSDVERYVHKHVDEGDREDFLGRFWNQKDLVLVGEDKFTSKAVLEADRRMVRMAERLATKGHERVWLNHDLLLSQEQQAVEDYVLGGNQLVCIEGRAGTGKSHVMGALRLSYEAGGYTVRGLAPTSAVANGMKEEGFTHASNLHSFLFRLYNSGLSVQKGKEVWLVDEAGMVSSPVMHEVVQQAWLQGAKLVLVGDERQLSAIERGGAFKGFCDRFGSRSLEEVRRQKDMEQRQLTEMISRGETTAALNHMSQMGTWVHHDKEGDTVQAMMDTWYQHHTQNPSETFMILEYRHRYVRAFNEHVHTVLKARGEVSEDEVMIRTEQYGWAYFSAGDKLVFRQNDQEIGVHNGMQGVILEASKNQFVVQVGEEQDIVFDPQSYNHIQHGYAGTIHSSQGATYDRVYTLHSSPMNQNLFYVANSRHRLSSHYFSHGDRRQVYKDIERYEDKALACADMKEEGYNWIGNFIHSLKDRFCRNHAFYKIPERHHRLQGALITDYTEDARLKGYLILYREEIEQWPEISGQKVRMSSQHRDLESTLRDRGVDQCLLLDCTHDKHLIGPYDRFGELKRDRDYRTQCGLSDVQMRVRLHNLEKRFGEQPSNTEAMKASQAYQILCHNEKILRPELAKTYDTLMTDQILYHFEKTGSMPNSQEIQQIQERVNHSLERHGNYKQDAVFVSSLSLNDPAHKQAEVLLSMYRSRQIEK